MVPQKPDEIEGGKKTGATAGTKLVSSVILNLEGKRKGADEDSQKALLKYALPEGEAPKDSLVMRAYEKNQPVNILDYSEDSEGDSKMHLAMGGDFCRKCGMKLCRCVDYSQWGDAQKRARDNNRLAEAQKRLKFSQGQK